MLNVDSTHCEVAIVGAGFGGIGMAIRLKRAGRDDFVILEEADKIGGTWRDNTYPGCTCDIPSHLYSLSFAPQAAWSRRYASQPEIYRYLEDCINRFGLRPHLRLGVCLKKATFDSTAGLWRLQTDPGPEMAAQVLVLATGMLHRPAIPVLPGIESFGGATFHSARWDHAVDLRGRRVAVIGTGASAVQLVPHVAAQAARLLLFQRTPAWVLPKPDPPFGPRHRWAMRHVPLLRRALRAWLYWSHEVRGAGFVLFPGLMAGPERRARSHAKRQLGDGELRTLLTPSYHMGCKRILLSDDFYPSLSRANVQLVSAPIEGVLPDGLVTADGVEHRADVLVFATGFRATDPIGPIEVVGCNGVTLSAAWRDGAQAHLGVAVAGFPNLFLLGGPNTGLGHNSVLFMLEAQIRHVVRCLRLLRLRKAISIEVRQEVQAAFARRLDRWMRRTVWLSGCRSWYLDRNGRNATLWPGFSVGYWFQMRLISARHYRLACPERRRLLPALPMMRWPGGARHGTSDTGDDRRSSGPRLGTGA
jgi:cation diffusion facilitator CzcD-associated flavoprotein CzcO